MKRRTHLPLEQPRTEYPPLDFQYEEQRRQWIIDHADYLTTIIRRNRRYERDEWPTLAKAEIAAQRTVNNYPGFQVLIYAVSGVHDTWVKTVKGVKHEASTRRADH